MAALPLRQAAPEMADLLAQVSRDAPPSVFYLYGDDGAIREASVGSAFDVGTILVVAAVAIPNLLRSKIAANEASAVGSMRTVNTAQVTYQAAYPKRGFAPNLAALGLDPRDGKAYSPEHAGLLDATLGNASCAGDAWCAKTGFQFKVTANCKQGVCTDYVIVATPVDPNTGTRSFCSTSDGLIRWKTGPALTAPMTISDCKTWRPLR
jgi:type IV pilus assembly protein PilA